MAGNDAGGVLDAGAALNEGFRQGPQLGGDGEEQGQGYDLGARAGVKGPVEEKDGSDAAGEPSQGALEGLAGAEGGRDLGTSD